MIEDKQTELDGHKVQITAFTAMKAVRLKFKYINLLGPGLFNTLKGAKKLEGSIMESDISGEGIAEGLEKILNKLSEDKFEQLMLELLQNVKVDGLSVGDLAGFNQVFSGNVALIYRVIWEVLKFNYGSFFVVGGIGQAIKGILTLK